MIEVIILQNGVEVARDQGKCCLSITIKDDNADEHTILNVYGNATAYESTLAACSLAGYVANRIWV